MRGGARGAMLVLAFVAPALAQERVRVWEINGIRLEAAQVERLAGDIARSTVVAVDRLDGFELRAEQGPRLEVIYRSVALDVYGTCVDLVNRPELSDAQKEQQVVDVVIAGQERSTRQVAGVLDAGQYATYRDWELRQVESFKKRGLWSRSGHRSRRRR